MKKNMLIVILIIVIISCAYIAYNNVLTKYLVLNNVEECYYHYRYFDQEENVCNDVVRLQLQDRKTIISILDKSRYFQAIDVESGFTKDYSLEFKQKNGKSIIILLQYGQHGLLRINDTTFDHELESDLALRLYTILNRYHRFARVLIAG